MKNNNEISMKERRKRKRSFETKTEQVKSKRLKGDNLTVNKKQTSSKCISEGKMEGKKIIGDKSFKTCRETLDSEPFQVVQNKLEFERWKMNYVVEEANFSSQKKLPKKMLLKLQKIKEKKSSSLPAKHPELEDRTIFVGNVNVNTKRRKVERFFSKYGEVESVRYRGIAAESLNMTKKEAVTKKKLHPGRESLIAYVRFKDKISKEKSLEANGELFEGLHIRVDSAIQGTNKETNSVFVGNLPWEANEEDLWTFFKECGKIKNVRIVRSSLTGAGKGIGFVSFESKDGVQMALHFNEKPLKNRPLRVKRTVKKLKDKKVSRPARKKSAVSSLLREKTKSNKMRLSFLKQDKPRKPKKEKHAKRKALKQGSTDTPAENFSGRKAVEDGKIIKRKRKMKRTKTEMKKFAFAKKLANTH